MQLSDASKRRLTIAKELYSHGYFHSMKKSPSDAVLSILNFDYSVETALKAALLDANIPLRRGSKPKSFDELIDDLRGLYPDVAYTSEVLSLHKLRNDVQHHSVIPSHQEVTRHAITARSFFDEICLKAYDGNVTFADISLALFITSQVEKTILAEMEKALQDRRYQDSVFYAKQVVTYHVKLLRDNMKVPHGWHTPFLRHDLDRAGFRELGEFVEDIDKKLDWIINRLCLREYHDEINEFLKHFRYGLTKREAANQDTAERARNIAYDFITRTQDRITKPDIETPFIFDLLILDKCENECTVQIGLASVHKIIEAKLTLKEQNIEKSVQSISTQIGLQTTQVKGLEKGKTYNLFAWAKNDKERVGSKYLTFKIE